MTGICTTCMKSARVPSHRGARLADRRSTCCSAPMMGPTTRRCPRCRAAIVLVWNIGRTESRCCMVVPAEGVESGGRFDPAVHQVHECAAAPVNCGHHLHPVILLGGRSCCEEAAERRSRRDR